MVRGRTLLLAALVASASACGARPGDTSLTIVDPYVLDSGGSDLMAFYATIENSGQIADTLVALSSGLAGGGSLHRMTMHDGMMQMEPVDALAIPPGEPLRLAPGKLHGMFRLLTTHPQIGDTIDVTLHFVFSAALTVRAPVRDPATADISGP